MADDVAADRRASTPGRDSRPRRPPPGGAETVVRRVIPDTRVGQEIVVASWAATGLLAVSALAAMLAPDTFATPMAAVSGVLFVLGIVVFALAYATAIGRSREVQIGIGELFFLLGSAPRRIQWHLNGSFAVQIVIALTAASIRPFTPVAFGTLVPMLGLGTSGLWAARHGTFDRRASAQRPTGSVDQQTAPPAPGR